MNKIEISKKQEKNYFSLFPPKKAKYKNRANKYCTAYCLPKYSAAEFLVLQTMSVRVHKHNQCFFVCVFLKNRRNSGENSR